jgi:hypothetical protein
MFGPLLRETEPRYTALQQHRFEDPMKLKVCAAAFALVGALALVAASANAQTNPPAKKKAVAASRDHTVQVSRDEDGKTRTRVIIQKRSYLDPGSETFPGERSNQDYAVLPNHRASGILDNTTFGGHTTSLPGPWTLPSKNNPWLQF